MRIVYFEAWFWGSGGADQLRIEMRGLIKGAPDTAAHLAERDLGGRERGDHRMRASAREGSSRDRPLVSRPMAETEGEGPYGSVGRQ